MSDYRTVSSHFQIIFLCIIITCLTSCAQQAPDAEKVMANLKEKYPFKAQTVHVFPDSLWKELYVPFLENGQYYIADYNGKRISKKTWDKIYPWSLLPYFFGEQNGIIHLYRYPETLIIGHAMKELGMKGPQFNIEKNLYGNVIYSLTVDSIIPFPHSSHKNRAIANHYAGTTVKAKYYFGRDQKTEITECFLQPARYTSSGHKVFREPSYRDVFLRYHVVVFTFDLGFTILDLDGRRVFKHDFWDILELNDHYVIVRDSNDQQAIASIATGHVSEYAFDTITLIPGCTGTFYGGKNNGAQLNWYLLTLDGKYFPVEERLENCETFETPKSDPIKPGKIHVFSSSSKLGVKNEFDSIILEPVYEFAHLMKDLKWVNVKKDGQYGLYHLDGYWIFPLELRRVFTLIYTDSTAYVEVDDSGYKFIINEKFELIQEKPNLFFDYNYFDWDSVPSSIRPGPEQVLWPVTYQEYVGFNDKSYGHIFSMDGKYISSSLGRYEENFVFIEILGHDRFDYRYIPIGRFVYNKIEYYVRMTDGFAYRKD